MHRMFQIMITLEIIHDFTRTNATCGAERWAISNVRNVSNETQRTNIFQDIPDRSREIFISDDCVSSDSIISNAQYSLSAFIDDSTMIIHERDPSAASNGREKSERTV